MGYSGITATIVYLVLAFGLSTGPQFRGPVSAYPVQSTTLNEVSGMVVSRANPGYLWVHNDSGDGPYLYLIDTVGHYRHRVFLQGAAHTDWEDMAIYTDAEGHHQLFVGDIGDNQGRREDITIYLMKEPKVQPGKELLTDTASCTRYPITYPDGPRDAETLLIDPVDQTLYLISKREPQVRVYSIPMESMNEAENPMSFLGTMDQTLITAGDLDASGHVIIMKTYNHLMSWRRKPGDPLYTTLIEKPTFLPYRTEPQGEAVAVSPDYQQVFTLSERTIGVVPKLYKYTKED